MTYRGVTRSKRRTIWQRDGGECHYCQVAVSEDGFTVDHVWPRSLGGGDQNENLVVSCKPCNDSLGETTDKCACEFCAVAMAAPNAPRPPRERTHRGRATIGTVADLAGYQWTDHGWEPAS